MAAYGLLLVASWLWRRAHRFEPSLSPSERVVTVPRVDGAREVAGPPVDVAVLDLQAEDSAATPVVLLHGSPGSNGEVARLASLLAEDRRAIAPDLPGFGGSTRSVPDYSIRSHARYLVAVLDSLAVRRAHFIGFSMGGGVATSLAAMAPDRVASLVLLSAIGAQEYELLGDYRLNRAIHGLQLAGLWLLREATPHFGFFDGAFFGVEYARNFYDTDQRPLRGILSRLEVPALIVQGRHDPLVHWSVAVEHHRIVPQSELLLLDDPGANHFMAFTRPGALAPAIADFLARADRGTALTRRSAAPERLAAAARPFDPATLPEAVGLTLVVLLGLIALATFVSEDLACIATGLIVSRGTLGFLPGTAACFAGIVIGDLGLYAAGRWLGRPALQRIPFRWFLSEGDVARSSAWFGRHGAWIALVTRFIPGTRLPTYFTAGMLHTRALTFLLVFVVAAALWTPLLVGLSAVFGRQVLATFGLYQRFALPVVLAVAFFLFLVVKLVVPLATWRGRRLLLSRWRRLTRWEYWPRWAFYPPIVLYVLSLAIRYRSLTLWTAANPAMPGGGFAGESKAAILEGLRLAPDRVAAWRLLPDTDGVEARLAALRAFQAEHGLRWPVVLKPDVGERGSGVAIIPDEDAARRYLEAAAGSVLAQEYVPGDELGVFWYRMPGEETGRIFAVTDKRFPEVVGDGARTLEELILADDRAVAMAPFFMRLHAPRLADVPPAGQRIPLVQLGTHSRGAEFRDGMALATPGLAAAIDGLSRGYDGFWFGRYDIRGPRDAMREGIGFKVIELNGSGSEATSIYDPSNRLGAAYATLRRQWALAFEIGRRNVASGARPTSVRELVALLRHHHREVREHVEA